LSDKATPVSSARDLTTARRLKQRNLTQLEEEMRKNANEKLLNKKRALDAKISKIITGFDEALRKQKLEKYILESDLKQTDMKLVTYFLELLMLDKLEPRDKELTEKLNNFKKQKAAIMSEIYDINRQFESMKKEAEDTENKQR
jgi:hypothetical protein